ncbi:MAG: ribonucleoside triphosphate reductase, partial [Clostridia bacterium]|nr:ribonucleoside triphosphate reductase [Clostridia bacterium]
MYRVTKRDGKVAEFDIRKISSAIQKAFDALNKQSHPTVIDMLSLRVASDFEPKIQDGQISVEEIQDSVEKVLSEGGYADVAKAYILYRKQREKVRNVGSALLNYKDLVNDYLRISDWRVKENSTVTYSVGGLILSNSGAITANYWLSEIYDQEVADAHRDASIHLHDLSMLTGYCAGWSLKQLIQEGLGGVPGKISSSPASHLSTLCNQMVNFLGIMQNEWAGAQAFSSFDTYLAPFVKVDNLSQKEVKQCVQSFVYGVNTPSRWGTQAPFSNITLDWTCPKDLENLPAIVGGKEVDFTYGECQKEMDMVNKAFIEIMIEGDANGRGFQ